MTTPVYQYSVDIRALYGDDPIEENINTLDGQTDAGDGAANNQARFVMR